MAKRGLRIVGERHRCCHPPLTIRVHNAHARDTSGAALVQKDSASGSPGAAGAITAPPAPSDGRLGHGVAARTVNGWRVDGEWMGALHRPSVVGLSMCPQQGF